MTYFFRLEKRKNSFRTDKYWVEYQIIMSIDERALKFMEESDWRDKGTADLQIT